MGAPTSGGSVVEAIRQQLAAGHSGDDVVEGLMAGGLSRPSAERFVQRAGGQVTSTAAVPPIPPLSGPLSGPPPIPSLSAATADADTLPSSPPPVPVDLNVGAQPFLPPAFPANSCAPAAAMTAAPAKSVSVLKVAGGAALLLVGLAIFALSMSASGRVRLKLPLALVFGGGATLVQAIRER
ncbi:MAG: hypothetical protein ABIT71_02810 [Vicinamibacteraceae bacterium]